MPRALSQAAAALRSFLPTSSSSIVSKKPKNPVWSFQTFRCSWSTCAEQRPTSRPPFQAVKRVASARWKKGFFFGCRRSFSSKSSGGTQLGSPSKTTWPARMKSRTSLPGLCSRIVMAIDPGRSTRGRFASRVGASSPRAVWLAPLAGGEGDREALRELVGFARLSVAPITRRAPLAEHGAELPDRPGDPLCARVGDGMAAADEDDRPRGERGARERARVR